MKARLILVAGLAFLASACLPTTNPPFIVAAAASFTLALDELTPSYAQLHGDQPTISIGSTGQLAQQIQNGAPFDVFLAADAEHMDQLIDAGLIQADSRTLIAYGRLVAIGDPDLQIEVDSLEMLVRNTQGRIAIANPDHAPYGQAALQALENSRVWSIVENRIIYAETVRQAAQMVESGNAEIGIVSASVVTDRVEVLFTIPQTYYQPIEHVAGVRTGSSRIEEADLFVTFLASRMAQSILQANGFDPIIQEGD